MDAGRDASVRPARDQDAAAAAELFYEVSPRSWNSFAGAKDRSLAIVLDAFPRAETDSSAEVTLVAEVEGQVAGVLAGFPVSEMNRRQWRALGVALRHIPPWRWPLALFHFMRDRGPDPVTPPDSYYVDALATDLRFRRRGLAHMLLDAAESRARDAGLGWLALDTTLDNRPAQALYESLGFERRATKAPSWRGPGSVAYVKALPAVPISSRLRRQPKVL